MKVKNHRQMMRSLTDPLDIPKLRALVEANPVLTPEEFKARQAQLIPEEWDELSPKEELYYQQGPFSTHEDFRGAKGGTVPQLVQPGPGRPGYNGEKQWPKKKGFVYDRVKKIFRKKKKIEPWKSVTKNQWGVFPSLEEQFKKIEEIWSGDTKYKSATDLAEAMGYKRSHSNVYSVEKLLKKYNEAKGLDLAVDDVIELVGETNRPKFSKVGEELRAKIVSDYEDAIKGKTPKEFEGIVSRLARKYGISKYKLGTYLHEAGVRDPEEFYRAGRKGPHAETKGYGTTRMSQEKRRKFKRFLSPYDRAINRKQEAFKKKINDYFAKNPEEFLKNPELKKSLTTKLDLTTGKFYIEDISDEDLIKKIKSRGGANQLFEIEHIKEMRVGELDDFGNPIKKGGMNLQFPVNRQLALYNINGGVLSNARKFINENPDSPQVKVIEDWLKKNNLRVQLANKKIVGAPGTAAIDEAGTLPSFNKNVSNFKLNKILNQLPKFTPKISGAGELYSFPANLPKMFKMMGSGTRKTLGWLTGGYLEKLFYEMDKANEMSKGKSEDEAGAIALENATFGATSSISKRKYIEHLEKVAEDMGIDPRAFESVYKMNEFQSQTQDTWQNYNESLQKAKDEGRPTEKLEKIMNKFFDDKQAEINKMAETVAGQISISKTKLPKPSLDQIAAERYNITDEDWMKPFAEIKMVADEKLKREKQSKWEDISQRSDTEAGDKGDWLNANIFNLQSLPRATKWWVDTINPFTPLPEKDAWMSDYEKERRALEAMTPEEREIYNREKRGLTYESPISEEAKENLKMRHPGLGYGLSKGGRVSYLDGGIVSLLKK